MVDVVTAVLKEHLRAEKRQSRPAMQCRVLGNLSLAMGHEPHPSWQACNHSGQPQDVDALTTSVGSQKI